MVPHTASTAAKGALLKPIGKSRLSDLQKTKRKRAERNPLLCKESYNEARRGGVQGPRRAETAGEEDSEALPIKERGKIKSFFPPGDYPQQPEN